MKGIFHIFFFAYFDSALDVFPINFMHFSFTHNEDAHFVHILGPIWVQIWVQILVLFGCTCAILSESLHQRRHWNDLCPLMVFRLFISSSPKRNFFKSRKNVQFWPAGAVRRCGTFSPPVWGGWFTFFSFDLCILMQRM